MDTQKIFLHEKSITIQNSDYEISVSDYQVVNIK